MSFKSIRSLCAGLGAMVVYSLALAAGDAGIKPPSPPPSSTVDKSPRCVPAAVNECRNTCMSKKYDSSDKRELDRKHNECKQDCIRGC